jgi:hypothetical protein
MILQINRKTLLIAACLFTGVVLLVAGVVWFNRSPVHAGRINVSPFENDMMENLLRGVIKEDGIRGDSVCFLSFGEGRTPPSSDFMKRFIDCHSPAVQGVDTSVSTAINRFFQKDNGRPGTIIQIIDFKQYLPDVFEITVSLSCLPHGHDRVVYRIAKVAGVWGISKRTPV